MENFLWFLAGCIAGPIVYDFYLRILNFIPNSKINGAGIPVKQAPSTKYWAYRAKMIAGQFIGSNWVILLFFKYLVSKYFKKEKWVCVSESHNTHISDLPNIEER